MTWNLADCDQCGAEGVELVEWGSEELCRECYEDSMSDDFGDDESGCDNCGSEVDDLEEHDGELLCPFCLVDDQTEGEA